MTDSHATTYKELINATYSICNLSLVKYSPRHKVLLVFWTIKIR